MSSFLKRRIPITMLLAVVGVFSAATIAVAITSSAAGGTVTRVYAVGSDAPSWTNAQVFNLVPGGSIGITVPSGETALVFARFTGESYCTGPVNSWCSVRILLDSIEMSPAAGLDLAFDTVSTSGNDGYESHSVERFLVVGAGSHVIRVQAATTGVGTSFRLDDWTLIVERSQRTAIN